MSEIKPFKAVHYDTEKISDLSKVVCPPYDVISKEQQENYYNNSEYNYIQILLGKDKPSDDQKENKYTRAKQAFERWQSQGVLVQDKEPSIYYYRQEYKIMGQKYTRLGFISLMKLPDEKDSKIFPHENTHSQAKEDRLKLWRTLSFNCSPIFVCFSDKTKTVEKIFKKNILTSAPLVNIVDDDGVRHILWKLSDPALLQEMTTALTAQELFIADGHHRFEVAREYRKWRRSMVQKSNGDESYNYVTTYFTNMDSKDLKILPIHRIIPKLSPAIKGLEFFEEFFRIDKIKSKDNLLILLAKAGQNEHAFGLYKKGEIVLLRLKNKLLIEKYLKEGSREYRSLDATILKGFVLDRAGIKSEEITYTHDFQKATYMVDEGQAEAAFIMNPVKIQQLKAIALNEERMPPKTTYFYPKVLSGLTIYKME